MNLRYRKIGRWVFIALTMFVFIDICFMQAKVQKENQVEIPPEELQEHVLFYYDERYDYAVPLFEVEEDTYYVYLPSFADASDLRVEIANAKVDFLSEDDTFSVFKDKKNNCSFQTETEYTMVFYDEEGSEIRDVSVFFMESENLATVYISTVSGSFEMLDEDKAYSEEAVFSFVSADGKTEYSNVMAEISARGNHTFGFEKKSYQFKLSRECDLLDMGAASKWILICNSYDLSNLRNKITYDMGVNVGMEGSPSAEFVDVYFNNLYHGTYLLSEKVEFANNRLEYEDMESKNKNVNAGKLMDYEKFFFDGGIQKGYSLTETPEDITGGYLIEHDYMRKYEEEESGFLTTKNEPYVILNPKHASEAEVEYISNLFQEIEDAIQSEDGCNPKTGKHYSEYIDMKSWADKYIVEEFTKNHGGGCTSSYFYKLPDYVSTKVYGGPIWDYDKAYARNGGLSSFTNSLNFLTLHSSYTELFYLLYQREDFREVVFEEWRNVFSPYIESEMLPEIDYYEELLNPALQLNFHRWEDMLANDVEVDTSYYRGEVEDLRQFIIERKETLDAMWGEEQEICNVRFTDSQQKYRSYAVLKGDTLDIVPNHWENIEVDQIWVDSENGEELIEGMVIDRDIIAVAREKE